MNEPSQKGSSYTWVALALAAMGQLFELLSFTSIAVLYPFIQETFSLTHAQVGLVTSAYGAGGLLVVLLAGWLVDSFGVKSVMLISLAGLALFIGAFPLIPAFNILIALTVLIGVTSAPLYPATSRIIMDWIPERIRALAMSLKHAGVPLASALAAAILPGLALTLGWRATVALTAVIAVIIALAYLFFYHNRPGNSVKTARPRLSTLGNLLRNRSLTVSIFATSVFVGLQFISLSYFVLFLVEDLQLSATAAGSILAIAQVSSLFARILWGAASDFTFKGRRAAVLAIIGFLSAAGFLAAGLLHTGTPTIIQVLVAILIGVSVLSYQGIFTTLVVEIAEPSQIATAVGTASTMFKLSKVVFPPLFGRIVDASHSYQTGWNTMGGLALISTIMLIALVREPRSRHQPPL